MPRSMRIALTVLAVAVVVGLLSFRSLHRRIQRIAAEQSADEQARHDLLTAPISTPTDVNVKAAIFWASGADAIAPVEVQLPLSADPVERSRQLLHTLAVNPPTPDRRTIPADAVLLGFYVLPDGTAVADFSDALSSETPSGILSEEVAVNSIAQTLQSNVPTLRRLKILIHGQEVDTLAGNLDLTGFFDLTPPAQADASASGAAATTAAPAATSHP
jgi:hypothetical protein